MIYDICIKMPLYLSDFFNRRSYYAFLDDVVGALLLHQFICS